MFTAEGRQRIRSTPTVPQGSWEGGAVGDVGVVKGKVRPELDVARGLYRLRLVNAGSLSVWNLFFGNRMWFWVIGGDTGLLDAPVAVTRARLSPAERVDLLVDFGDMELGSTVELCNDEPPPFQAALIGERTMPRFCRFRVGAARGFTGAPPATLRGGRGQPEPLPPIPRPDVYRDVTLSRPSDVRLPPSIMSLNNLRYSTEDIEMLPQPPLGIRWTPSADAFTISPLVPAEPWERGFKDTVPANANSVTRIVVAFPTAEGLGFDPDAVFGHGSDGAHGHASGGPHALQGYVWHCHILDHEDHEMMLRFRAVA